MNSRSLNSAILIAVLFAAMTSSTLAQQGGGGGGGGGGSSIPGPTGAGQCFVSTASGAGNWIWGSCSGSSSLAFSSLTTGTNTGAVMTVGSGATLNTLSGSVIDFSATAGTSFKLPATSSLVTSANGNIGYDATGNNWHAFQNSADSYLFSGPVSASYANGHCLELGVNTGTITLVDTGSACSPAIVFQVNGTGLSSPATVNFQNSAATNGLTLTFTNPSSGNVKLGFTGTLSNAGLANSAITIAGTSVSLGGSTASLPAPGPIGGVTPSTGAFTSISASSPITSTVAIGTAPFSITSTTVVPNLNVSQLLGATWAAPGTIGSTTPNTAAFTTLSASSTVTFSGITGSTQCLQINTSGIVSGTASPCGSGSGGGSITVNGSGAVAYPINFQNGSATDGLTINASNPSGSNIQFNLSGTYAGAVAATTLSASSTVSGTGFSTYLASPPAIGSSAAASGAFTTLSASSTVSGTGFSTYLASPPAIGGTVAAAGTFTAVTGTSVTDSGLTNGDCVQAGAGGILTSTSGACASGGISGLTPGVVPQATSATAIVNSSPQLDNGVTTSNTLTYAGSGGIAITSSAAGIISLGQGTTASTGTTAVGLTVPTSVTSYNISFPGAIGATGNSLVPTVSGSVMTMAWGALNLAGGSAYVTGTLPLANMAQVPFDTQTNDLTTPTGNMAPTFPAGSGFSLSGTAPSSGNAAALFTLNGVTGASSAVTSGTAGTGSAVALTGGNGGAGTGTNTKGGPGGSFTLTTGNGGASTGTANNSNGGSYTLALGSPGTGGSGTTGSVGNLTVNGAGSFTMFLSNSVTGAIANSPALELSGAYQSTSGPAYATDYWLAQDIVGSGVNGTSTLTFTHSGTSGAAVIALGAATATTQSVCDNSTKVATTAYAGAVCNLVKTTGSPLSASAQSQTIWNNTASPYIVDLPTPTSSGPQICLGDYKAQSSAISFVPGSGVTIYYKGIAGTTGSSTGLVSGGAAGDFICVEGTDSTTYEAIGPGQGTWVNN